MNCWLLKKIPTQQSFRLHSSHESLRELEVYLQPVQNIVVMMLMSMMTMILMLLLLKNKNKNKDKDKNKFYLSQPELQVLVASLHVLV